jgi:cyclohexyl-isocyanide hydratase
MNREKRPAVVSNRLPVTVNTEGSEPAFNGGPRITTRSLSVGCLIYAQMDQIDFTGPFEVLSRMPDTIIQAIGKELASIRDVQGLRLTPDLIIADAGVFDILLVPGGHGQQALMHNEEVLALIREHVQMESLVFSVCTGAPLCGAAGVLTGRQVTTHWSVRHLVRYYGANFVDARVVVDGNMISAAGVTAGLDAALVIASLLRGDAAAQEIQLAIEYAPNPVFHSGTPESAPAAAELSKKVRADRKCTGGGGDALCGKRYTLSRA